MPSAAFTTLGCKVNQYETQKILESFEQAGFEIVPFDAAADVYVINSCSVTSIAEGKSRYMVRKAARTNPSGKIVLTGCAAQMALNKGENVEGAHLLVPNPEKMESLFRFLEAFPDFVMSTRKGEVRSTLGRTRATLKVQDGCDVFCSYCSIPFTRPGLRSRPFSELLREAKAYADLGYQEIVLTGVLIGAYGPESGSEGPRFEEMVRRLGLESGCRRIRISSIEMTQVTGQLIGLLKDGIVMPHLHIPLQSGNSDVLRDMHRPYSQEDYLKLCERLYMEVSDITLTTDIMVGFPTETPERFKSTLYVCEHANFSKAHVFRFSPRHGTLADRFGDPVSDQEKTTRSLLVSELTSRTGGQMARRFLGRTMRVLVETKSTKDGLLEGLSDNYLRVRFNGPPSLKRNLCSVRALAEDRGDLLGELLGERKDGEPERQPA